MTITVLIADDHAVVAEGLRCLIQTQSDMTVVDCVHTGRDAVRRALETQPHVVVMDVAMPALNGTEATQIIRSRQSVTRVLMLSMFADPVHVCRALQAGADGYVVKKALAAELIDAIRAVHGGRRYLGRPLVDSVIDQFIANAQAPDPLAKLSTRERHVLQMLAEGHSVAAIAAAIALSPKTVETYRSRMMNKLDIHDLAGLVRFAVAQGVVTVD
jgi:DNA-binding NarL/FixJ family response regulator